MLTHETPENTQTASAPKSPTLKAVPSPHSAAIRHDVTDEELELPVEEVAARLGLPASMLIRRIEAGDIPARRIDDDTGVHYRMRIADLGTSSRSVLPQGLPRNGTSVAPLTPQSETADVDDSHPAATPHVVEHDVDDDILPPPPARATVELTPLDRDTEGPRAELAMMALDPRELVAGLLDRWERTLEQRIYAEQRQRFEAELTNRQAKVKQLQLELDAVRAEHAAALAEKERRLAERERDIAHRERELDELRAQPRRGWFFRR
jgi:hypothetical protein